jgi:uncharacterized cupredoxin-like copper-binding protein
MKYFSVLAIAATVAAGGAPLAHADAPHAGHADMSSQSTADKSSFGRAGDPHKVTRTINVDMSDSMRFSPASLTVKQGQTVRFAAKNSGKIKHEIVLGTMRELKEHAEMMKNHPEMEHDEPYMAHVAPGKTGRIVWQFTTPGEYYYGCLIPGHFEAGMIGKVVVE